MLKCLSYVRLRKLCTYMQEKNRLVGVAPLAPSCNFHEQNNRTRRTRPQEEVIEVSFQNTVSGFCRIRNNKPITRKNPSITKMESLNLAGIRWENMLRCEDRMRLGVQEILPDLSIGRQCNLNQYRIERIYANFMAFLHVWHLNNMQMKPIKFPPWISTIYTNCTVTWIIIRLLVRQGQHITLAPLLIVFC